MIRKYLTYIPYNKNNDQLNRMVLLLACFASKESVEDGRDYFANLFSGPIPQIEDLQNNKDLLYNIIDKIDIENSSDPEEASNAQIELDNAFRKFVLNEQYSPIYPQVKVGFSKPTHEFNFDTLH